MFKFGGDDNRGDRMAFMMIGSIVMVILSSVKEGDDVGSTGRHDCAMRLSTMIIIVTLMDTVMVIMICFTRCVAGFLIAVHLLSNDNQAHVISVVGKNTKLTSPFPLPDTSLRNRRFQSLIF